MNTATLIRASFGLLSADPDGDSSDGDYSADVRPPARSKRGTGITEVLSLPTAYRAIQIIAGMGAQLTLADFKGDAEQPTPALLEHPDPWRSLDSWVERVIVCLATEGNAFLKKVKGPLGNVVALIVLNPFGVTIWRDKYGRKFYTNTDMVTRKTERLNGDEVIHLWAMEVPGLHRALGPIGHARVSLGGALDLRDYAAGWFAQGDVPTGILKTDSNLDAETAKFYKSEWQKQDGYAVKVIGHGLDYKPVLISPKDAQWLESQQFAVTDIARLFGVPASYLLAAVEGSTITYQNLEQVDSGFLRTTLFPVYLRKIEAALTEVLPRGHRSRFRTDELLRPDAKTTAEIDAVYHGLGVYTTDEIRARKALPPLATAQEDPTP